MKNLNENETKALEAICADCDEIDGWGFNRPSDAYEAVANEIGAYDALSVLYSLEEKGAIELCLIDDTLWVRQEVYATFC